MGAPIEVGDRPDGRVTDLHVHIQPWDELRPEARALLASPSGEKIRRMMEDPEAFLAYLDEAAVERAVLINYVSPDVMGFTEASNDFVLNYARAAPDRLIPIGSVHPRFSRDPAGDVRRLAEAGIRGLKLHPPHQLVQPNAYRDGLTALQTIYETVQDLGLPVMIHTGTSVFPGARNMYADPLPLDDVAVDFPELTLIVAHGGRPLWMETAVFLVRRHPNVYLDLSSIPPHRLLDYFPRLEELARKAAFGTDWPGPGVPGIKENVEAFRALSLSPEAKRAMLVDTAATLFP